MQSIKFVNKSKQILCNILQVGRPIFNSTVSVPFRVVEALKDVPGYEEGVTELGEVKLVYTIKKDS